LSKNPREDDRKEIERLRDILLPEFEVLDGLHRRAIHGLPDYIPSGLDDQLAWDNPWEIDDTDDESADGVPHNPVASRTRAQDAAVPTANDDPEPPETRRLSIPSRSGSTNDDHRQVELEIRIQQASKTLQVLRDSIADKSFQYSHVIRVAPKKGVNTRARATIAKLTHKIDYYCRVYGRCRAAMVRLGADNNTLDRYQILLKEHVKSSTAMVNPNEAGSTRLQLSWIWKTPGSGNTVTPEGLRECEFLIWTPPMASPTLIQSTEFIGSVPGHKNTDGRRN